MTCIVAGISDLIFPGFISGFTVADLHTISLASGDPEVNWDILRFSYGVFYPDLRVLQLYLRESPTSIWVNIPMRKWLPNPIDMTTLEVLQYDQ